MALGLPVISTNVGGMPFLIDNNNTGVLVEPENKEVFISQIIKLIKNPNETKH